MERNLPGSQLVAPTVDKKDHAREREFGVTDAVPAARPPLESSMISAFA
jgi:hypothetical protein